MLRAHLLQRLRRTARWPADGPNCERGWSSTPSSGRGTRMAITQPGSPRRRAWMKPALLLLFVCCAVSLKQAEDPRPRADADVCPDAARSLRAPADPDATHHRSGPGGRSARTTRTSTT